MAFVWGVLFLPGGKKFTATFSLTILVWFYICIFESVFRRKLSDEAQSLKEEICLVKG